MAADREESGQLILLAGVLLVLAYLLFSIQAVQFQQAGQQAGREARDPVLQETPILTRFLATALQEELRKDSDPAQFLCPYAHEFKPHAQLILRNIAVHEQNRGLDFNGDVSAVTPANPTVGTVNVVTTFSLSSGPTFYRETVTIKLTCTTTS